MANPAGDRPLTGTANFTLILGATATMVLFYLFVVGSVIALLLILAVEAAVLIAIMRFGLGGVIVPVLLNHGKLLGTFFRSMRLGNVSRFQIPLKKNDDLELYLTLKTICQKARVPLPRKVLLEMGVNAWVHMKGYRAGSGTTILGIGYDLMAGLSRTEFEGVVAHEMMHAKLVQRGFRQLLSSGVGRAAHLTNRLSAQITEARRLKKTAHLAETLRDFADRLTRIAARQVSACSRQDEFAADRGAAMICGAGALRSSLLKLEDISLIASRLGMRERMAQLESGEGFSQWLIQELVAAHPAPVNEAPVESAVFNKYSTHPSLQDRLAALSTFEDQAVVPSPPAIELLAHPDEVAAKLVAAIQKRAIEEEQKDSKQLDRWSRKAGSSMSLKPRHGWALALMFLGPIACLCVAGIVGTATAIVTALVAIVVGVLIYRSARYRDKLKIPIPEYPLIKAASSKKLDIKNEEVLAMEAEFQKAILNERKPKRREDALVRESYQALETCDYVRAHVAARLCLQVNRKSIPGALAFTVAAGRLMQSPQVGQTVRFLMRTTGMKGASPAWAAGWGLALLGDWMHAEAFLDQARTRTPASTTILALLAISQNKRGKLFSAIASARKAHSLQPGEKEYAKLLIDLLLQAGFLREAHELLVQWQSEAATDTELMVSMVRLSLMSKHDAVAEQWTEFVAQSPASPHKFIHLGEIYEAARRDEKAAQHFQQALAGGHYPEALIGLGRLEIHRRNKQGARAYFTEALNLTRPVGEQSANPVDLVSSIFQQLKLLGNPALNCQAWIATMSKDMAIPALANISLLVYALSLPEAKMFVSTAIAAMQPDLPPPIPSAVTWKTALREQQPDGPVIPGIQAIFR